MISKSLLTLQIILLLCLTLQTINCNEDWNYDDQNLWNLHFKACNGKHESPINIDTRKVLVDSSLKITFHSYDKMFHKSTAQNNGHTVRVFLHPNPMNEIMPYITGPAVMNKIYHLDSFHLHWGLDDTKGSEHSIDHLYKSAELHLVHWNSMYGSMTNATDKPDGLVVVTVFVETKLITEFDGWVQFKSSNPVLTPIIDILPQIQKFGSNVNLNVSLNLKDLVPNDKDLFFKYTGSLTTPPCSESAEFIIFVDPIYISSNQIQEFRQIKTIDSNNGFVRDITENRRNQQPVNDRIVWVSDLFSGDNTLLLSN